MQSCAHSAHVGQDVLIHYRWHPLHMRRVRCVRHERRASGEVVHVELAPGVITMLAAWKIDAVHCAGFKVGAPHVSLAALCSLHELLIASESRLICVDGSTVTQEAHDGIADTAHAQNATSQSSLRDPDGSAPARPRFRRRASSRDDTGGASCRRDGLTRLLLEAAGVTMRELGDDNE